MVPASRGLAPAPACLPIPTGLLAPSDSFRVPCACRKRACVRAVEWAFFTERCLSRRGFSEGRKRRAGGPFVGQWTWLGWLTARRKGGKGGVSGVRGRGRSSGATPRTHVREAIGRASVGSARGAFWPGRQAGGGPSWLAPGPSCRQAEGEPTTRRFFYFCPHTLSLSARAVRDEEEEEESAGEWADPTALASAVERVNRPAGGRAGYPAGDP